MLDFFFHSSNIPFLIALGVMLGLGAIELLSILMGGSIGFLSDSSGDVGVDVDLDVDVDFDLDMDPGIDAAHLDTSHAVGAHEGIDASGSSSLLQQGLGWLHLGKLPLMIILVLALFSFGSAGMLTQSVTHGITGHLLPWPLASLPALVVMVFFVRFAGLGLIKFMPQDETQAVSSSSFVGREATMVIGTATFAQSAQAKLVDQYGKTHYVMVRARDEDTQLPPLSRILIISKRNNEFHAIVHPLSKPSALPADTQKELLE